MFCDKLNRFAGVFLLADGCYGAGSGFLFEFGSHVGLFALARIHVISWQRGFRGGIYMMKSCFIKSAKIYPYIPYEAAA